MKIHPVSPLFASILLPLIAFADHPSQLPDTFTTGVFDYDVSFDDGDPYDCSSDAEVPATANLNFLPRSQALRMAEALDRASGPMPGSPAGYHPGYINLGFQAPDFGGADRNVRVFDCEPREDGPHEDDDCDNGQARSGSGIRMPATVYCSSSERNIRRVMGHELFHFVQFSYTNKFTEWGKVAMEATARMMEDQVYADIDGDAGLAFDNESNKYLGKPNQDFWRSSYQAALAWKYMAEQYGTVTTEPQVGVDFIIRFLENVNANNDSPDAPATIKQTIQEFSPGTTLREWFHDFTIANVAKEFDVSGLPDASKYDYIDNNDGNGTAFKAVDRDWTGNILSAIPAVSAVSRWGASYYEAQGTCVSGWFMGYRARNADDARHALLAVTPSGTVERLIRGSGEEFAVAFLQPDPPLYDRLIAVITGGDEQIPFSYAFDCGPGTVDALLPNSTYQAFVGPPNDPRTMIVRLKVSGPSDLGGASVVGLQKEDFSVYIGASGNPADEASIVGGADVQGEYWITVRPPIKPNNATYPLHVLMDGGVLPITDTNNSAVSYEEKILDQVLVIDRSGSMSAPTGSPKIQAAKNAATLFVDIGTVADRLGAVSFSTDATLDAGLDDATDMHKQTVKNAIKKLSTGGGTSIGDGLDAAADELVANGSAIGEDWIVLLSDGMENEPMFWDGVEGSIKSLGIRVNTIALGADADQTQLQEIANETGGEYYYVDVDSTRGGGGSVTNSLADAYASSLEIMRGHERLWEVTRNSLTGDISFVIGVNGDGIAEATFLFNWDDADEELGVEILRPNGTPVSDGVSGASVIHEATHVVAQVGLLTKGNWTVNLSAETGTPSFIGILSGRDIQGPVLGVQFGQNDDDVFSEILGGVYLRGLPQPIIATLIDKQGAVTGARVFALVEHPDGTTINLRLVDDGMHGDGGANDGIYGNSYTKTTAFSLTNQPDVPATGMRGSYNVVVNARGVDNQFNQFERIRKGSFQILETDGLEGPPSDTDMDGMPDRYENLHSCINRLIPDAPDDADQNGIDNVDEYNAGFNPCHPDTDRGGETDVSELSRGANPFNPSDDALPRPIDAEVIDYISEHLDFPAPADLQPNSLLIRYQVNPLYQQMRLLRRSGLNPTFSVVAVFDAQAQGGLYRDEGLVNGVTYDYRVQPLDANGNAGTPSHIFSGTPRLDPIPPIGSVVINHGTPITTSTTVNLSLTASAGTVEVKISNLPDLDDVDWVVFESAFLSWIVTPDPATGHADVYVVFRDGAGNVSPTVYNDSIRVVALNQVGTIFGTALLAGAAQQKGATPAVGITLEPLGPGDSTPEFSKSNGMFIIRNLEPGNYALRAYYPDYDTEMLSNINVIGGGSINVGTIILGATDTDGDGIPDIDDNCINSANVTQLDTDSDGFGNACDLDLNDDCLINFADLATFKDVFFTSNSDADTNGDGAVNFIDLAVMQSLFFGAPGPSGTPNICD